MKENIEEDIECIQEFLEYSQDMINDMDYERPVDVTIYQNQINSLEHILSDYKRVLKENEDWQKAYQEEKDKQFELLRENQKLQDENEKLKDLKAVYSGALEAGELSIANMIKGGIDLIEKLQKENEELKYTYDKALSDVITRVDLDNTYISKQKIKDKIEFIEKEGYWLFLTDRDSDKCVEILQDLLEER